MRCRLCDFPRSSKDARICAIQSDLFRVRQKDIRRSRKGIERRTGARWAVGGGTYEAAAGLMLSRPNAELNDVEFSGGQKQLFALVSHRVRAAQDVCMYVCFF